MGSIRPQNRVNRVGFAPSPYLSESGDEKSTVLRYRGVVLYDWGTRTLEGLNRARKRGVF